MYTQTLTNFELLEPGDDDARGSGKIKQLNSEVGKHALTI